MKPNVQARACNPNQLEALLRGELSAAGESELTMHLNTCEKCRRLLEQQASEPEGWLEAERLLRESELRIAADRESLDSPMTEQSARQSLQIQNVLNVLGPTDDPAMLGRLGGYEVSGVVGTGGMGIVLKAIDKSLDRTVAIKVLAPHLATSGAARKRFAREAKAAATVLHSNVIAIHSVANDGDLPYLVMPYVRGSSLQKRLDEEGPLSLEEILRIGSQVAAGLAAAHAQGIVHRDIKPANILLEEGTERVTITDFGLARAFDDATITRSGVIAGTPQYMSPEQARGETLDGRSDLFSLGSVLYAISTGRPPFRAETTYGVMRRITDDQPRSIREVNPEIPTWLCAIVARLMSKRAGDRYESAGELGDLLERCLAHVQQPASAPLPAGLVPRSIGRRWTLNPRSKGVIAMVGTMGLLLVGAVAWQVAGAPRAAKSDSTAAKQPAESQPKVEADAKQKLIDGILARADAVKSGVIEYHLKSDIGGRTNQDRDYHFAFSGESWVLQDPETNFRSANHDGRLMRLVSATQPSGVVKWFLEIDYPDVTFEHQPAPPVRAGTIWYEMTKQFVHDGAGKARLQGRDTVNGIDTQILEWDVSSDDRAFHAFNNLLFEGGKLRLYVAPQLGFALARIEYADKFGTPQIVFNGSDFKEVAPKIYFPMKFVYDSGSYVNAYDIKSMKQCNEPIPDEQFVLSVPSGTSVSDVRRKATDKVLGADGKHTYSIKEYPYRHFGTGAAYPKGFPAELLKELDRDVAGAEKAGDPSDSLPKN